jgi:hypothetical protein
MPHLEITELQPLGDGYREASAEAATAAVASGDVGDCPTIGIAGEQHPDEGDFGRGDSGLAISGTCLEPLDGLDRAEPVLRREPSRREV